MKLMHVSTIAEAQNEGQNKSFGGFLNLLGSGVFEQKIRRLTCRLYVVTDGWSISCEISLRWMSMGLTEAKSTMVPVMGWYHQGVLAYGRKTYNFSHIRSYLGPTFISKIHRLRNCLFIIFTHVPMCSAIAESQYCQSFQHLGTQVLHLRLRIRN